MPFNKVLVNSENKFVERRDDSVVASCVTDTKQIVQQLIPGKLMFQLSSLDNLFICLFVYLFVLRAKVQCPRTGSRDFWIKVRASLCTLLGKCQ